MGGGLRPPLLFDTFTVGWPITYRHPNQQNHRISPIQQLPICILRVVIQIASIILTSFCIAGPERKAYPDAGSMPPNLRPNRVHIDMDAEALCAPICGSIVPFHLRTIKNMSRSDADNFFMLRVNFFTPGQGKGLEDYPSVNGQRVYVKELSFRSQVKDNLDSVLRTFKEMQKRGKQRELEGEVRRGEEASGVEDRPLVA